MRNSKEGIVEQELQLASAGQDPEALKNISVAIQAYTHAAKWFESNVAQEYVKKAKTWRALAVVSCVMTVLSILAVVGLTPLKTVVPYLVRVDNNTGFTDLVQVASGGRDQERVDDEYWLTNYVRFRESYNFADNDANYQTVKTLSHPDAFTEYRNFQISKKGYTETLGKNRQMRVVINGVTFLPQREDVEAARAAKATVQVRLTKTIVGRDGVPDTLTEPVSWIATISYDYNNPPKNKEQEFINPRGFGALSYSTVQFVKVTQ